MLFGLILIMSLSCLFQWKQRWGVVTKLSPAAGESAKTPFPRLCTYEPINFRPFLFSLQQQQQHRLFHRNLARYIKSISGPKKFAYLVYLLRLVPRF